MRNKNVGILVIEEDESAVSTIKNALREREIAGKIDVCRGFNDAVDYVSGFHSADDANIPTIAITEMSFTDGNGIDVLKKIRLNPALNSLCIFVMTDSDDLDEMEEAFQYNVAGYIHKDKDAQANKSKLTRMLDYWEICEFV